MHDVLQVALTQQKFMQQAHVLNHNSTIQRTLDLSGTCLSFSCEDKNLFVVGSENGGIYKCSLQTSTPPSLDFHEADLQSPIKFSFRPHYGPVYDISCSPFHRNLFLSCATDTTTRMYSLLDVSRGNGKVGSQGGGRWVDRRPPLQTMELVGQVTLCSSDSGSSDHQSVI